MELRMHAGTFDVFTRMFTEAAMFLRKPGEDKQLLANSLFCSFSHRSRTETRTQSHALMNTGAQRVFQPSHNELLHSARRAGLQTRRRARQVRPAVDVQSAALLVGGNSWRSRGEICGSLRQEHAALPSGSQRVAFKVSTGSAKVRKGTWE